MSGEKWVLVSPGEIVLEMTLLLQPRLFQEGRYTAPFESFIEEADTHGKFYWCI